MHNAYQSQKHDKKTSHNHYQNYHHLSLVWTGSYIAPHQNRQWISTKTCSRRTWYHPPSNYLVPLPPCPTSQLSCRTYNFRTWKHRPRPHHQSHFLRIWHWQSMGKHQEWACHHSEQRVLSNLRHTMPYHPQYRQPQWACSSWQRAWVSLCSPLTSPMIHFPSAKLCSLIFNWDAKTLHSTSILNGIKRATISKALKANSPPLITILPLTLCHHLNCKDKVKEGPLHLPPIWQKTYPFALHF